jgi:NitT/TauT family transport system substrate-binding protein
MKATASMKPGAARSCIRGAMVLALLTLTAANVAGCRPDTASEDPGPDRVRAVVTPYLSLMAFHIAQAEGYFADENLEVEFVRLARHQDAMAALATGDVDVTAGIPSVNELSLALSGARVRMVASLNRLDPGGCSFTAFLARRELAESGALSDPERVRGLSIDADPLAFGLWVDRLLEPLDLTIDDLDVLNLRSPAAMEALANGTLDIALESEPFLSMLAARDEAVVWQNVPELVPGYVVSTVFFGPSFLDERPEVGERFASAMLRGLQQYRDGKTERNMAIVLEASGLSRAQLEAACWPSVPEDPRIHGADFAEYQEWLVARGLLDRVVAERDLIDQRFLRHALGRPAQ